MSDTDSDPCRSHIDIAELASFALLAPDGISEQRTLGLNPPAGLQNLKELALIIRQLPPPTPRDPAKENDTTSGTAPRP